MINFRLFSLLYFSVANGEPTIGIPWETFQKYREEIILLYRKEVANYD